MAAPAVRGVGAASASQSAITPAFPTSAAPVQDDILIGIAESVGTEAYFSGGAPPTGWAHVTGSPVAVDTSTRLTVIWKRFVGGDTAPSWGDSGNHNVGRIIAISGVRTTGNPWGTVTPTTSQETAANTSAEWPDITTSAVDFMIVLAIATGRDLGTTANLGVVTNANLTSITERMDDWSALGTGGGIGMVTGLKATASAIGVSTATMGSTDSKALMTIALEPAAAAVSPPLTMIVPAFDPDWGRTI